MYEYVGAIHIHSSYSDGTRDIPEIAEIAETTGLDYLLFADHMTLQPLVEGKEGWYGRVLALIGYEIHDPNNKNHYLAFDIAKTLPFGLNAHEYVAGIKKMGGLGIIAHPDEVRTALPNYPSYPWTAWDVDEFDGLEIWNHMSEWMEKLTKLNRLSMAFSPRRSLRSPTKRILNTWDRLNLKRKVVGVGGLDVHAYPYRLGPVVLTIFPYKVQFKSIRTHLLLADPLQRDLTRAKGQIYGALRRCRAFVSNYRWGDARGFSFRIRSGNKVAEVGDQIALREGGELWVQAPLEGLIRVIRNGEEILTSRDIGLQASVSHRGVYRVEVHRGKRGWIYSNHIWVI